MITFLDEPYARIWIDDAIPCVFVKATEIRTWDQLMSIANAEAKCIKKMNRKSEILFSIVDLSDCTCFSQEVASQFVANIGQSGKSAHLYKYFVKPAKKTPQNEGIWNALTRQFITQPVMLTFEEALSEINRQKIDYKASIPGIKARLAKFISKVRSYSGRKTVASANLILAVTFSFFQTSGESQNFVFKVLATRGEVEVKSSASWQRLVAGSALAESNEIRLKANSYLGLVHSGGKPLELKNAGTYIVSELANGFGSEQSVLSKYTNFILSSSTEKKNTLSATGAVHRDIEKTPIAAILPEKQNLNVFGSRILLRWVSARPQNSYVINITNTFGDLIGQLETNSSFFDLDLSGKDLQTQSIFVVQISSKEKPEITSSKYLITRLSEGEKNKFQTLMDPISKDCASNSALSSIAMAGFYEENSLLIDAITAYEDAIRLEPNVEVFARAYSEFRQRHGLN